MKVFQSTKHLNPAKNSSSKLIHWCGTNDFYMRFNIQATDRGIPDHILEIN
jgi:hypothetical protein